MKLQFYIGSGGCHNTYFETKRSDGNDEENKLNKARIKRVYVIDVMSRKTCNFVDPFYSYLI